MLASNYVVSEDSVLKGYLGRNKEHMQEGVSHEESQEGVTSRR
jgi:hypothetical protein